MSLSKFLSLRIDQAEWRKLVLVMVRLEAVCLVIVTANSGSTFAARVGRSWPAGRLVSIERIDHVPFDGLLRKYVDSDGYVSYTSWDASRANRQALLDYLSTLGKADPQAQSSGHAKLAFWINAYNATTIEGILREYPTSSIWIGLVRTSVPRRLSRRSFCSPGCRSLLRESLRLARCDFDVRSTTGI